MRYAVDEDTRLAALIATDDLSGDEIWPALRRLIGNLDLGARFGLRVDLRELRSSSLTEIQLRDLAEGLAAIERNVGSMRVAFVLGASAAGHRLAAALGPHASNPGYTAEHFTRVDEADAWLLADEG